MHCVRTKDAYINLYIKDKNRKKKILRMIRERKQQMKMEFNGSKVPCFDAQGNISNSYMNIDLLSVCDNAKKGIGD